MPQSVSTVKSRAESNTGEGPSDFDSRASNPGCSSIVSRNPSSIPGSAADFADRCQHRLTAAAACRRSSRMRRGVAQTRAPVAPYLANEIRCSVSRPSYWVRWRRRLVTPRDAVLPRPASPPPPSPPSPPTRPVPLRQRRTDLAPPAPPSSAHLNSNRRNPNMDFKTFKLDKNKSHSQLSSICWESSVCQRVFRVFKSSLSELSGNLPLGTQTWKESPT